MRYLLIALLCIGGSFINTASGSIKFFSYKKTGVYTPINYYLMPSGEIAIKQGDKFLTIFPFYR